MKRTDTQQIPSCIDDVLRYALAIGAVIVVLLPAARGFNETVGWLPMWLLAMPLVALWARRGFRLPRQTRLGDVERQWHAPRRRRGPQAHRRSRPASRSATSEAA